MANLDSRSKREAGPNQGLTWLRPLPLPDGVIGEMDRATIGGFYDLTTTPLSVVAVGAISGTKVTAVATFDQTQVTGSGSVSNTKVAASVSVQGD